MLLLVESRACSSGVPITSWIPLSRVRLAGLQDSSNEAVFNSGSSNQGRTQRTLNYDSATSRHAAAPPGGVSASPSGVVVPADPGLAVGHVVR